MLKLISYQKSDAAHLIKWLKNETVFRYWCTDYYEKFPITADQIIEVSGECFGRLSHLIYK